MADTEQQARCVVTEAHIDFLWRVEGAEYAPDEATGLLTDMDTYAQARQRRRRFLESLTPEELDYQVQIFTWHDQQDAWFEADCPEETRPGPAPEDPTPYVHPEYHPSADELARGAAIEAYVNREAAPGERPDYTEPTPEEAQAKAVQQLINHELGKIRVREEAKRQYRAEAQGPPSPIDLAFGSELALCADDTPTYRVKGLMLHEGSTLITAQRKAGKTTLLLNLARSLLTGEKFLDEFDVEQVEGTVALLNYEVSRSQFGGWVTRGGVPGDRFLVASLRGRRNPLGHPEDRAALAGMLKARSVEVLMVDPFANAFTGDNQNDAGQVASFLHELSVFTREEVGATDLVLTNHAGWSAERTRGSSALEDWGDSLVKLVTDEHKDRFLSAIGRDVDVDEGQLIFNPETLGLSINREANRAMAEHTKRMADLADAIVAVVYDTPGLGVRGLQEALSGRGVQYKKENVQGAINAAVARGVIEVRDEARGKRAHHPRTEPVAPDPDPAKGVEEA